ncbi:non-homologous end-joining DNA ligase [Streptomyces sp. ISL-11]|uniref:non-homologous end-joining DNA ligase n=1 Tax=Streptomyces sp. ISL-11 TaxID=2819174 RepID=UPI001BE6A814|nr:non-homologous end-joining DNA ligase [Streptomyces sp. ISL-11]MBT2387269.1 non-homologous end-joining DNA ligase [Streptomyces sp. ISL-11]
MGPTTLPVIQPMLATPGPLPAEGEDAAWAFEVKWDGVRCVVSAPGDGTVRLVTRAGNDATMTYPELRVFGERFRRRAAVLDGEVVVLDAQGRPDFGLLQRRMGVMNPRRAAGLAMEYPVHLMLFDIMHLDDESLIHLPYRDRRSVLAGLRLGGTHWSVPSYMEGHGRQAWNATLSSGFEGVLAKRLTSRYTPGARSPEWRKTKHVTTIDVVIGGWAEGRGALAGLPGAVLVGLQESGGLRYAGSVGSGLSDRERRELARYLHVLARADSPFAGPVDAPGAHWVEPRLIAEITFSNWTPAGHLRHPTWHRLRPDLTRLG